MYFVAIGRGEILYKTIKLLNKQGHSLVAIITDTASPEYRVSIQEYEELAKVSSVPFLASSSRNQITHFLRQFKVIDIGVSVNHRKILSADILNQFKLGVLNFHGGDLPRFKGNACQAWAIINGEEQIGACVYRMEADLLDSGKIMSRRYFALDANTKIQQCLSWLESNGPAMFAESLEQLHINPEFFIEDSAKIDVPGLRCHERRPEDGYVDWNKAPEEIVRLVNASGYPYFGAFSFLNGRLIKILEAKQADSTESFLAVPGQVIEVGDGFVLVACGHGSILISEIDYGGGPVKASTILKSTRIRLGSKHPIL